MFGVGTAHLISPVFDDGLTLICEYLVEGVEFSYSALKNLCSHRSNFQTFVQLVIRNIRVRLLWGTFPSLLVGLWQSSILERLEKRVKDLFKTISAETVVMGALAVMTCLGVRFYRPYNRQTAYDYLN